VPTYYQYFGLEGAPFDRGSTSTTPFVGSPQRETIALLETGMARPAGAFTLLVGESGVGKTTLVKEFLTRHPEPASEWGDRAVIIVDEAEDLTDASLEDLWRLAKFEAEGEKRLHFVLIARPELVARLQSPPLHDIDESIGIRATINPLPLNEAPNYVDFWVKRHGGSIQRIFDRRALRCLIQESGGIPRRINILCDRAMRVAYDRRGGVVSMADAQTAVTVYRNLRGSPHAAFGGGLPGRPFSSAIRRLLVATGVSATAVAAILLVAEQSGWKNAPILTRTLAKAIAPSEIGDHNGASAALHDAKLASGANATALPVSSRIEPATLPGVAAAIPDSGETTGNEPGQPVSGFGQDDLIEQSSLQNSETGAASANANTQTEEDAPASADGSESATTAQHRPRSKDRNQKPKKPDTAQEMVTNDNQAFANANHVQSQLDKPGDPTGNAHIQSLDPNWRVVSPSH
jgi:type II secretory pathway predicted ATPase ExeA